MIKVEPCKGCGGVILVDDFMGVRVRCDVTAVDAHTATQAVLASRPLYRLTYQGGQPHSFASAPPIYLAGLLGDPATRPSVVAAHQCSQKAAGAVLPAFQDGGGTQTPKAPPEPVSSPRVAPGTPSSAPTAPSSATATTAGPSRSKIPPTRVDGYSRRAGEEGPVGVMTFEVDPRNPRCSGCGKACADGTYASIGLGEIIVWAHHVDDCGA